LRRKQKNVVDEQTQKLKEKQREQREAIEKDRKIKAGHVIEETQRGALSRFSK
jgi:hypothetical protein